MVNNKQKNIALLIGIVLLASVNLWLYRSQPAMERLRYDKELFSVKDTSSISLVTIENRHGRVQLKRNEGWELNESFTTDARIRQIFFSLMHHIRIARKPGNAEIEQIRQTSSRLAVKLEPGIGAFDVWTNATRTRTFFAISDDFYEMEVPGYRDFIASIFELHPDQWQDRLLLDASWRSIQLLSVTYPLEPLLDFQISFDKNFFKIGDMPLDSNAVVEYLNLFQGFQANEMISKGRMPLYDSLRKTQAELIFQIEDIKYPEIIKLEIYQPLPGQNIHLGVKNDTIFFLIDSKRARQFFKTRNDFEFRKSLRD